MSHTATISTTYNDGTLFISMGWFHFFFEICQHIVWYREGVCSGNGSGTVEDFGMDDGSDVDDWPDVSDKNSTIFQHQQYK